MRNNLLFSLFFFVASCTAPEPKPTCQYSVTANPCTVKLVYIPQLMDGEPDLDVAIVLNPKQYSEVVINYGTESVKCYVLNSDISNVCASGRDVMDKANTYPYEKAMVAINKYNAIKDQRERDEKGFKESYKSLLSQL